jgi:alpha-galactosidase
VDRRTFLLNSAALAVTSAASELNGIAQESSTQTEHPIAPPVSTNTSQANLPPFDWEAAGLTFSFHFFGNRLRSRIVLPKGTPEPAGLPAPVEFSGLETSLHCTGEDIPDHHGAKFTGAFPGARLSFIGKEESATSRGKRLTISQEDQTVGLRVQSIYETVGDMPVVQRSTRLTNIGQRAAGIEYASSAMLNHFASPDSFQDDLKLHFAYNSWQAEAQWRTVRMADAGLVQNGNFSVSGASFSTMGSWPCQSYLPMAMLENTRAGVTWFWQIEHNGSWHFEIAQTATRALYAYIGGPDAQHAQAWKELKPGESYDTVPVAIGCVRGGFDEAVAALTRYRRAIQLHPRSDMRQCPVVFNDVLAINGDQTTAIEMPLIDAAAAAGCEVYCMDVGWCTKPGQDWWDAVGDWEPNPDRFPGGFKKVTTYIRTKGMVPGLWIEPEVCGLWTSLAKRPDNWFFMRHGKRVIDHSRYQLDFRNPEVRAYTDQVFDRIVRDYGIGYIKLDYNINALEGTELQAESFGQGLLEHNRAFLGWLDALLDRYPTLTLETVASGGMRMEYSMLSRAQLQSISDQDDYRTYASLTTGCSAALLPEQMGVWSQPSQRATPEEASCNMVNAMLGRIHQSGYLTRLSQASLAQVENGIAAYKRDIRRYIPEFTPFYPLGMADMTVATTPAALGMRARGKTFLAVWRRNSAEDVHVPGNFGNARLLYPMDLGVRVNSMTDGVTVSFPKPNMGCILTA